MTTAPETAETPISHLNWSEIAGACAALHHDAILGHHHQYGGSRFRQQNAYASIMASLCRLAALLGHRLEPIYAPGSVMLETEAEADARHVAMRNSDDLGATEMLRAAE